MLIVRHLRPALLVGALLLTPVLHGCSGDDGGPSGPELGEEVDLSLYSAGLSAGDTLTYRTTTEVDTVESSTWYYGVETINYLDPSTGLQTEVECVVTQEEDDGITGGLGDMRTYFSDNYVYGVKIWGGGTWEPFYPFRPRWQVGPDENPRINGTFDSQGTSVVFADDQYRQVISLRTVTTYMGVIDSLTVPAGTFHDVLWARTTQHLHYKVTTPADTTTVIPGAEGRSDSVSDTWDAPGFGTIKLTAGSGEDAVVRVLVRARLGGTVYPSLLTQGHDGLASPRPEVHDVSSLREILNRPDPTIWSGFASRIGIGW